MSPFSIGDRVYEIGTSKCVGTVTSITLRGPCVMRDGSTIADAYTWEDAAISFRRTGNSFVAENLTKQVPVAADALTIATNSAGPVSLSVNTDSMSTYEQVKYLISRVELLEAQVKKLQSMI